MRLIRCRLRQVRQHGDLEVPFGRRMTLIGGANEAGKSTLVEALHKALFLRATATGRGVEELRSRLHAGLPEVEVCFEAAGLQWQLRKRFAGASGTCQLSSSEGPALSGAAAEERLAQLLGFEAPVEGRRIAQLPERWAHLWVRQSESGLNPIGANQERYDVQRLVDQLQARGNEEALASPLDRRVIELIEQQVAASYTATGRVKAGSELASAQQRAREAAEQLAVAQQRLADLESAMEQLRRIGERLETIDGQQRPRLQRQLQLQQQQRLLQTQLQPLIQQQQLWAQLSSQHQEQQQQQRQLQRQLEQRLQEQRQLQSEQEQQGRQLQQRSLEQQRQRQHQELLQQVLDHRQLEAEQAQLQEHQQQLQRLQSEAEQLKAKLAALPAIQPEQVRQLRQAEQALLQATTRCQALATGLEVIASDQRIELEGEPLQAGERRQLSRPVQLQVGSGVVLRIHPGGGDDLPALQRQAEQCQRQLQALVEELGVEHSDAAETIERQRRSLESDLGNLRQAARAIPWSGLTERLAQIEPRRQRLLQVLSQHQAELAELASDPAAAGDPLRLDRTALEGWLEQLKGSGTALHRELEQLTQQQQQQQSRGRQLQTALEGERSQLAQLEGSLTVLAERLKALEAQQAGDSTAPQLREGQAQLQAIETELARLGPPVEQQALEEALAGLEQDKNALLTQRGQAEQLCQSLGALNPLAELEQRQAVWEDAEAERQRLESRAQALLLLQERFHRAQTELATRYSEPLREAIEPYLIELFEAPQQALLGYAPQQGFLDLQLRQGDQTYPFEQLSGGMREQLAAALRLAMAEVLLPAYDHGLPLVFDDAFSQSDPQRLQGLKRMLGRGLRQGVQIVLLSCNPNDYIEGLVNNADATPTSQGAAHRRANNRDQKTPPTGGEGSPGWPDVIRVDLAR